MRVLLFLFTCLLYVVLTPGEVNAEPEWNYTTDYNMESGTGEKFSSVAISADGEYIVAGAIISIESEGKVYLFSKDNSTPLWNYTVKGNGNGLVRSVAISADGEYIVVGAYTDKVYLFHKDNSTPLWTYNTEAVSSVAISADGKYIVAGTRSKCLRNDGYSCLESVSEIHFFSNDNSNPIWSYSTNSSHVSSVAISADGEYFVIGTTRTNWNNMSEDNIFFFHKDNNTPLWSKATDDLYGVNSVAISDDGKYFAVGSVNRKVYLFSSNNSTSIWDFTIDSDSPYTLDISVDISANGEYIVAGIDDRKVYLFNNKINEPILIFQTSYGIGSVAISANGKYIVAGEHVWYYTESDLNIYFLKIIKDPDRYRYISWSEVVRGTSNRVAISADGRDISVATYNSDKDDSNQLLYFLNTQVPERPIAVAGDNITSNISSLIHFDGKGSVVDGWILTYEWDFDGDGIYDWSSVLGGMTTYSYNNSGIYNASLRVTNNDGVEDVDVRVITIREPVIEKDNEENVSVRDLEEEKEGTSSISIITVIVTLSLISLRRRIS